MKKTAILLAGGLFVSCTVGGELTVGGSGGLSPRDALLKIRADKAAGDKSPWTVRVKPGLYTLTETLTFTPSDSGTPDAPVAWIGEGRGAVFSGGAVLGPWTDAGNGVWEAPAPRDAEGKPIWFEQLWVNGHRMSRSRFPNEGYFHVCRKSTETKLGEGRFEHRFFFSDERVRKALAELSPEELGQAQALAIMKWSSTRRVLRRYEPDQGALVTYSPIRWETYGDWAYLDEKEGQVCFENLRCGFDAPGEWFYDGTAGKVLYRPKPGEKIGSFKAVAPVSQLCQLVKFEGHPGSGLYVSNIRFENLTFAHSAGTPYDGNRKGPSETFQYQAAYFVDGAISARGARQITFDGCTIRNTGNYGICFDDGTVSNRIVNCRFGDVGAGGIRMGAKEGRVAKGEKLARRTITTLAPQSSAFNVIDNCLFRHGGYFNPEGTAIAFTHISDSKILHCDISDFYYTGISVGFAWGYAGSVSQRNEIAFNRIGNLGKGVMSDMAGIYLLATSFGTTVHDNIVHDIDSFYYGGNGIYIDEGGEGIVVERNLVWNTTNDCFHQHYGCGCLFRNNIGAFSRQKGLWKTSRQEVEGVPSTWHMVGNILLSNGDLMVGPGVYGVPGVWAANNLWFDTSGRADFGGRNWAGWQASGKESGGVYADPRFVDAAHYDFRLKADSPALKMGFRPWDYTQAGLRPKTNDAVRVSSFGYDAEDSTRFIQKALDSGARKIVLDKQTGPWVTLPLKMRSDTEFIVEPGVELVAKRGAYQGIRDFLLEANGVANIAIRGGKGSVFRMWKEDYRPPAYKQGEWRHALRIFCCTNVVVEGLRFESSGGDGLSISGKDIVIRDCVSDRNHRQGLSLFSAENVLIENCVFSRTSGTAPEAGIDIEPDLVTEKLVNVQIRNCRAIDNAGSGFEVYPAQLKAVSGEISILFDQCVATGNRFSVNVGGGLSKLTDFARGKVMFRDCEFLSARQAGVVVESAPVQAFDVAFAGCVVSNAAPAVKLSATRLAQGAPDGVDLGSLRVFRKGDAPWFDYAPRGAGPAAERVTGDVTLIAPDGKAETVPLDAAWRAANMPALNGGRPLPPRAGIPSADAVEVHDAAPGEAVPLAPCAHLRNVDLVLFADKPGPVVLRAQQFKIVPTRPLDILPYEVRTADGRRKWELPAVGLDEAPIRFDAPARGFYRFRVPCGYNRLRFLSSTAPVALDLTGCERVVAADGGRPFSLFFAKPAAQDASVYFAGDGYYKFGVTMMDPSGKTFVQNDLVESGLLESVPASAAVGLWRLDFRKAAKPNFDWVTVDLYGAPNFLFLSDRKYWTVK